MDKFVRSANGVVALIATVTRVIAFLIREWRKRRVSRVRSQPARVHSTRGFLLQEQSRNDSWTRVDASGDAAAIVAEMRGRGISPADYARGRRR